MVNSPWALNGIHASTPSKGRFILQRWGRVKKTSNKLPLRGRNTSKYTNCGVCLRLFPQRRGFKESLFCHVGGLRVFSRVLGNSAWKNSLFFSLPHHSKT
jgi:hypothetical protein